MLSKLKFLFVISVLLSGCVLGVNWRDRNKDSPIIVEYGVFGGHEIKRDDNNSSFCSYLNMQQLFGDRLPISFTIRPKNSEMLESLRAKKFRVAGFTDDFGSEKLIGDIFSLALNTSDNSILASSTLILASQARAKKGTVRSLTFQVLEDNKLLYSDCIRLRY